MTGNWRLTSRCTHPYLMDLEHSSCIASSVALGWSGGSYPQASVHSMELKGLHQHWILLYTKGSSVHSDPVNQRTHQLKKSQLHALSESAPAEGARIYHEQSARLARQRPHERIYVTFACVDACDALNITSREYSFKDGILKPNTSSSLVLRSYRLLLHVLRAS